ncbi:MAG: hypothetical protein FD165_445 [Gammaproteobacteria bacterium]|nr:MAG: hypothetical protein FD165_445 [Gammaproteobacteria bacterium]TND02292.1 MAG: hypothetical protein FD120_2456 [Gammaproteobacteria bacterium]
MHLRKSVLLFVLAVINMHGVRAATIELATVTIFFDSDATGWRQSPGKGTLFSRPRDSVVIAREPAYQYKQAHNLVKERCHEQRIV